MPNRAALRDLLLAHRAEGADEQAHRARMLALLDVQGDPFARAHFDPGHFTASAFVITKDGGALLLIRHPKLGRFLQPGGHIEPDDPDVLAAARREVREEVGLSELPLGCDGIFDLDVHRIPPLGAEPAHEHFDVRFLFVAPDRTLRLGAETEAKEARFFELAALERETDDASVLRAARKLRARR